MSSPAGSTATLRKALRRFRRNRRGSAAVEFALVAPVFFALLFAIIETAIVFFAGQVLETVTQDSARFIMTGQAQTGGMSAAQFKDKVCAGLPAFFDCQNKVQVDVRTYTAYLGSDTNRPLTNGVVNWVPQYNPGGKSDIVVVRAIYPMPTYTNFYGQSLANMPDGSLLLMASSAFKNEPF